MEFGNAESWRTRIHTGRLWLRPSPPPSPFAQHGWAEPQAVLQAEAARRSEIDTLVRAWIATSTWPGMDAEAAWLIDQRLLAASDQSLWLDHLATEPPVPANTMLERLLVSGWASAGLLLWSMHLRLEAQAYQLGLGDSFAV